MPTKAAIIEQNKKLEEKLLNEIEARTSGKMRLSKEKRDVILANALAHAFGKEKAELKEEHKKLSRKCYDAYVPKEQQAAIKKLPSNWFNFTGCATFILDFSVEFNACFEDNKVALPKGGYLRHYQIQNCPDLTKEANAYLDKYKELQSREETTKASLSAMLNNFNTLEDLIQQWPEGELFYRDIRKQFTALNLPVMALGDLNKMLGIGKK